MTNAPSGRRFEPGSRAHNLWYRYRMTTAEYDELLVKQDHRCASCGRHESEVEVHKGGRPRRDGTRAQPNTPL